MKFTNIAIFGAVLTFGAANVATADSFGGWSGGLEAGYGATSRFSTDTDIIGSPFGGFTIGGYATTMMMGYDLTIDGRFTQYDFGGETDAYITGPKGSGALGVHLGTDVGGTFVGGFAAVGIFEGYADQDYMTGYIAGIEASRDVGGNATAFAQLGYANLIGDPTDNEFVGAIGRIGVGFDISNSIGMVLDVETGYSADCYVDCVDQPGSYTTFGIDLEYDISSNMAVFLDYERLIMIDYDDEDTGTENNIMIGLRMSFGGGNSNNLLATPMGAFKAAGWMEALD